MTAQMEYDALVAACTELDTLAITLESQRDTLENEKPKSELRKTRSMYRIKPV